MDVGARWAGDITARTFLNFAKRPGTSQESRPSGSSCHPPLAVIRMYRSCGMGNAARDRQLGGIVRARGNTSSACSLDQTVTSGQSPKTRIAWALIQAQAGLRACCSTRGGCGLNGARWIAAVTCSRSRCTAGPVDVRTPAGSPAVRPSDARRMVAGHFSSLLRIHAAGSLRSDKFSTSSPSARTPRVSDARVLWPSSCPPFVRSRPGHPMPWPYHGQMTPGSL